MRVTLLERIERRGSRVTLLGVVYSTLTACAQACDETIKAVAEESAVVHRVLAPYLVAALASANVARDLTVNGDPGAEQALRFCAACCRRAHDECWLYIEIDHVRACSDALLTVLEACRDVVNDH